MDPARYPVQPGKATPIVKAFQRTKEVAERTVLAITDAESPLNA